LISSRSIPLGIRADPGGPYRLREAVLPHLVDLELKLLARPGALLLLLERPVDRAEIALGSAPTGRGEPRDDDAALSRSLPSRAFRLTTAFLPDSVGRPLVAADADRGALLGLLGH
jgi:hypothetical protein